jgi:hypothetical protein
MNRLFRHPMILGAVAAALVCASLPAQAQKARQDAFPRASDQESAQPAPAPSAAVADAPNARLAGLINRNLTILRNKNIASVQRVAVGAYCITPKAAAGITPSTAIVVLTTEYYYSLYNETKVQWATKGSTCGANKIAVYTFADANLDGVYTPSNAVAFSIVVP